MGNFNLLSAPPLRSLKYWLFPSFEGSPKSRLKHCHAQGVNFGWWNMKKILRIKELCENFWKNIVQQMKGLVAKKSRSYWTTEANTLKPILNEGCKKATRKARHSAKATRTNALSTVMTLQRDAQKSPFLVIKWKLKGKTNRVDDVCGVYMCECSQTMLIKMERK